MTAFTLLQDLIEGNGDPVAFLDWARGLGANTVRVFGMWSITNFDPRTAVVYYQALDACAALLADKGLRLHYVAFTDQIAGSSILMHQSEQLMHWEKVAVELSGHDNVFVEVCNEDWKNGRIAANFSPQSVSPLYTRSSWEDGLTPLEAGTVLDFTTEHTPRGDEWERKAKNLLETSRQGLEPPGQPKFPPTNKPAIAGEPERMQNATPRQYADYVAVAELFASGACLHGDGDTLQRCRIPADDSVARAVAAVWADPPPADLTATGTYVRGQKDGGGPCPIAHSDDLALRTFAMIAGNRATTVVVSPRPGWQLQPVNGWRVVRTYGYDNNTIDLER